jgi:hypothetical protein
MWRLRVRLKTKAWMLGTRPEHDEFFDSLVVHF